jgi:hypothetical protein
MGLRRWMWMAALMGLSGAARAEDVAEAFDCDALPRDLLEQSLAAGESLFLPGEAEKFGWRPWDEAFQEATGLREDEFFAQPESGTIRYLRVVYQRLDMSSDGHDELVAVGQYPQGMGPRIEYSLHLFCDSVDWHRETCDGSSLGARASAYGGYRFRILNGSWQDLETYSITDLKKVYLPESRRLDVSEYDHGIVFLQIGLQNYVIATELFYGDETKNIILYGSTIWPLTPQSLGIPTFCTWRK